MVSSGPSVGFVLNQTANQSRVFVKHLQPPDVHAGTDVSNHRLKEGRATSRRPVGTDDPVWAHHGGVAVPGRIPVPSARLPYSHRTRSHRIT